MKIISRLNTYFNLFIGGVPRYIILKKFIKDKPLRILDVGCGTESPFKTKKWFPAIKYYGIDKSSSYINHMEDLKKLGKFWSIDLENSTLEDIPDNFFDVIIFSHVIEHLINGKEVLLTLTKKLKLNGVFYIEFPSLHTKSLPSLSKLKITFNFYDDRSHKKLYNKNEILNILEKDNFKIIKARIFFNWKRILFFPFILFLKAKKELNKILYELWNIVGWCTYVLAIKE
ncbi:MAG: class I SAM-dependent methyltransferase [Candidatus Thorarchaeota archaeon]